MNQRDIINNTYKTAKEKAMTFSNLSVRAVLLTQAERQRNDAMTHMREQVESFWREMEPVLQTAELLKKEEAAMTKRQAERAARGENVRGRPRKEST